MTIMKYEILEQTQQLPDRRTAYRIKAVRDFGNVKKGEIGGFVEADDNLSHHGLCWIAGTAMALGRSRVTGDAQLKNRAQLRDWAVITDRCAVQDEAVLQDFAFGYGDAVIGEQSLLAGVATACGHAQIFCRPRYSVSGKTRIPTLRGNVMIRDYARLEGKVTARDDVVVCDGATIKGNVRLIEKAYIGDESVIEGCATIGEKAVIVQQSRIGGLTKIFGRVLVAGQVAILGKSFLTCCVRVDGGGTAYDIRLSGDTHRQVTGLNYE